VTLENFQCFVNRAVEERKEIAGPSSYLLQADWERARPIASIMVEMCFFMICEFSFSSGKEVIIFSVIEIFYFYFFGKLKREK